MTRKFSFITKVAFALVVLAFSLAVPTYAAEPAFDEVTVAFELTGRDGEPVTYEDYRGKNVLLAFGFTHCLHICPMIAANMASVLRVTDKDAVGIFISVDTERDTPEITDVYASKYSSSMTGLSGSHEQVAATAKNFNATFVVTKSEDTYTVQHTPSIYLIGPDGELIDVFAMNAATDVIVGAMR
jgi:protein SCO1/2